MTLRVEFPMNLPSVMNLRESWPRRAKRFKAQREAAAWQMAARQRTPPKVPLTITLTRIGAGRLDDDNLAAAFKAVRDGVADWLGIDDGHPMLRWVYEQEVRRKVRPAVRVEIREC